MAQKFPICDNCGEEMLSNSNDYMIQRRNVRKGSDNRYPIMDIMPICEIADANFCSKSCLKSYLRYCE